MTLTKIMQRSPFRPFLFCCFIVTAGLSQDAAAGAAKPVSQTTPSLAPSPAPSSTSNVSLLRRLVCTASRGKKEPGRNDVTALDPPQPQDKRLRILADPKMAEPGAFFAQHHFALKEVTIEVKLEGSVRKDGDHEPYGCVTIEARYGAFSSSSSRCEDGELATMQLGEQLISELQVGADRFEFFADCQLADLTDEERAMERSPAERIPPKR